ncbi:MAG: zf-HC2 domain-containing protein [Candidatus Sericytochromatia bacterium]|nr:zf-HC2 domain-containing protein [Candidatus Sericytochromatia bacterium]
MMRCQDVRDRLTDYFDGALAPEGAAAMRSHLLDCAACRRDAAAFRVVRDCLGRMPAPVMPEDLPVRISERLASLKVRRTPAWDMGCEEAQDSFTASLEGALEREDLAAWQAHLSGCSDCRRAFAAYQGGLGLLRRVPAPPLPTALEAIAFSRLRQEASDVSAVRPRSGTASPRAWLRPPRALAWIQARSALFGAAAAMAALFVWNWLPGVGLPRLETAVVPVRQDVAVHIGFETDEPVDGVVFQVDLPEGLQFVDERAQPMLAQSVSWRGALAKGKTVVPIVVRGIRPGRYAIEAVARKGPLMRRTTIVLPVEG